MSRESVKTLAAKRVRRQKIFIAVGSVLLLAILGFELPKVMGGKGGTEAVATTTAPAPGAPAGAAPVVPAAKLPDTDQVAVVRDSNQLISFGLFKTKDPFVQQLSTTPEGPAPSSAPTPIPAPTGPTATPPGGTGGGSTPLTPAVVPPGVIGTPAPPTGSPGSTVTTPGATTPSAPVPAPTDALIATNGVCERVSVKGTFPTDENIFRLASIAKDGKSIEVGIVGGSFDNGHPTAPLKVGEKITLVNTADGTRYEIVLKTSCNVIAAPGSSTTQSTTTTPIAPAPTTTTTPADTAPATTTTTTATTPIVTDSLDTTTPTG
jgi:hypothetical protein